jgi:glutamate/tyrosine decarboxylase-like PLP-dependent enzyme
MKLPENGRQPSEVLSALDEMRANDARWRDGRTFSLVYYGGDELLTLLHDAFFKFFSENALNPMAFPSLRRMETEVLSMVADLLHGPDCVGSMTTGGTESILMAVKTAREFAANTRGISRPEMILPDSVHPAFHKAAHYFNVKPVVVPVGEDYRADVAAMRAAITPNTILLVGSAPSYPQGVVDPIPEIAALAEEHGLLCHVDACLGGMLLPFFVKLGQRLPAFDFAVPGVTSMSCDLHKYGYAAKGASTVLYRSRALRRHQFVVYTDWSGGLYGSPSMTGTRAGGPIGAAWAVLNYLGESGYLRMARQTLDTVQALVAGVRAIPGLAVMGEPDMSVFSFATTDASDIYRVGDEMDTRGWHLDRQQRPPSLHMMITAAHTGLAPQILADLAAATEVARAAGPATSGAAAMYGMMGSLPDRTMVREFVLDFMDGLDR